MQGAYDDAVALAKFASDVSVVTFEFENVEPAPLEALAKLVPLHPSPRALSIGQDRCAEKRFAAECGGRTAEWAEVNSRADLDAALARIGTPQSSKRCGSAMTGRGRRGSQTRTMPMQHGATLPPLHR